MTLTILEILDLAPPLGIGSEVADNFVVFYVQAENLITDAQNRDSEVIDLYTIILADIDNSQLSNAKGNKTAMTNAYEVGQLLAYEQNSTYYLLIVEFVKKLQTIVVDRYGSLDNFYGTESITVSQVFADISEEAGFPISPQYIEDIS
jgi:hypothetical protein